jgi:hypothetical protein
MMLVPFGAGLAGFRLHRTVRGSVVNAGRPTAAMQRFPALLVPQGHREGS